VRIPLLVSCLSLLAISSLGQTAIADDGLSAARADVRRDLAIAKAEARYYWQVDYPQQQRDLNAAIELTEAEIQATRLQLRQYEPFDRFSTGQPLYMPIQGMRLCLLEAEQRLENLRQQRNALIRFHSERGYLLDQRVADIRARLVELEGGEVIEVAAAH
jgi:multidrug efflux pump subunit AcrA (membrane-fusion protein)